jgi:hypothetical protein
MHLQASNFAKHELKGVLKYRSKNLDPAPLLPHQTVTDIIDILSQTLTVSKLIAVRCIFSLMKAKI